MRTRIGSLLLLALVFAAAPSGARVLEVEIETRRSVLEGRSFGAAGAYEALEGRIVVGVDPKNDANARIADSSLAAVDAEGLVRATADLLVLQPVDPEKRSGTALVEVPNRGRRLALASLHRAPLSFRASAEFDPADPAHIGDGFLFERGLTIIWVGWQADAPDFPGALKLAAPIARDAEGRPIRGPARSDWVVEAPTERLELAALGHAPLLPADPSGRGAVLTRRRSAAAPREVVTTAAGGGPGWRFSEDRRAIVASQPFEAGWIYELVYEAEAPPLLGMGFAAFRDVAAFAKGDPRSPFPVKRAVAIGSSQSGRFLRHFLQDGFNRDESGGQAYDGVVIQIGGAGKGGFNHRFGHPGRVGNPFRNFGYPGDDWPFASRSSVDPARPGRAPAGVFDRAVRSGTAPKIFQVNGGYEYWGRGASLVHTSADGVRDLAPLPNERHYHVAGAPHYPLPFPPRPEQEVAPGIYRGSSFDNSSVGRALVVHMLAWVEQGEAPPPSRVPTIASGGLVAPASLSYPVAGLVAPARPHAPTANDYGPRWAKERIVQEPPTRGAPYGIRVPAIDALGNEAGGIQTLWTRVPVGTWAPWALRSGMPFFSDEMADYLGTFVPLAATAEEKREGDDRPSLAERYASEDEYLAEVDAALDALEAERFLLPVDRARDRQAALERFRWVRAHSR